MNDETYTYTVTLTSELEDMSGPVEAALLAQSRLTPTGATFEITHDSGSLSTVKLSKCNPWTLIAQIRELMLDEDLSSGDTVEEIGILLDRAGLAAE